MMEIVIYITCGFIFGFAFYLLSKKKDSGDPSVLSTQLSELSRRFTVLEEAAKNMGNMQSSIDTTFKSFQNMLDDKQERGAFSEVELEKLLRDRLPSNYLKFQETLSNGKRVDCLIDFGDINSRIGIDSKFVLDNFKSLQLSETKEDIKKYKEYENISEIILFDSKGYEKSISFDHNLLDEVEDPIEKMIAGNIKIEDVTNFKNKHYILDVSGSLESSKGVKDINKIDKFLNTVHNINS